MACRRDGRFCRRRFCQRARDRIRGNRNRTRPCNPIKHESSNDLDSRGTVVVGIASIAHSGANKHHENAHKDDIVLSHGGTDNTGAYRHADLHAATNDDALSDSSTYRPTDAEQGAILQPHGRSHT